MPKHDLPLAAGPETAAANLQGLLEYAPDSLKGWDSPYHIAGMKIAVELGWLTQQHKDLLDRTAY